MVLGGTSLTGGQGGGLGSIIGALNMYLITYLLSTFSFGNVSGFVTQLASGVILMVSLLVGVVLSRRRSSPIGG